MKQSSSSLVPVKLRCCRDSISIPPSVGFSAYGLVLSLTLVDYAMQTTITLPQLPPRRHRSACECLTKNFCASLSPRKERERDGRKEICSPPLFSGFSGNAYIFTQATKPEPAAYFVPCREFMRQLPPAAPL